MKRFCSFLTAVFFLIAPAACASQKIDSSPCPERERVRVDRQEGKVVVKWPKGEVTSVDQAITVWYEGCGVYVTRVPEGKTATEAIKEFKSQAGVTKAEPFTGKLQPY